MSDWEHQLVMSYTADEGELLAALFRALRARRGETVTELARRLGQQRRVIDRMESAPYQQPLGLVLGYAVVLGLGVSQVMVPLTMMRGLLLEAATPREWLVMLRAWAGMSRAELAKRARVSRQTVNNWENRGVSLPVLPGLALVLDPNRLVTDRLDQQMDNWMGAMPREPEKEVLV